MMYQDSLIETFKPPYSIPTLDEIRAIDNGLTAVSTFSGCGGSSTGLHWAGFRIPWASEFIPAARETYLANWPETYVDARDIREVQPAEILDRIGLDVGELDLFEGSPPCSSFSVANNGKNRYGALKVKPYSEGVKQATDDLFDEWLRLVEGIRPRAVLAENVPGLLMDDSLAFYGTIHARLASWGYRTTAHIYSAASFGAATTRQRLIISGVRADVSDQPPPRPRPSDYSYTIRDAFDTFPGQHDPGDLAACDMTGYAVGDEWERVRPGDSSGKYFQLVRVAWTMPLPSPTVAGKNASANPMHPDERRQFTPAELAWMFGYPPDYRFTGNAKQRHERVARSVSPPLYRAHGEALARVLKAAQ